MIDMIRHDIFLSKLFKFTRKANISIRTFALMTDRSVITVIFLIDMLQLEIELQYDCAAFPKYHLV